MWSSFQYEDDFDKMKILGSAIKESVDKYFHFCSSDSTTGAIM